MDLLIFERKRGIPKNYRRPVLIPVGQYHGILAAGEQIIVVDPKEADDLNVFGCYGEFLQRRKPRVSVECFKSDVQQQPQQQLTTSAASSGGGGDGDDDDDDDGGNDSSTSSAVAQKTQRAAAEAWKRIWPTDATLRLGMEEALYLSSELGVLQIFSSDRKKCDPEIVWKKFYNNYGIRLVQRYATYRYFRQQGWVVRPGLQYGVDFMLYYDGPEYHHSSAGVRIISAARGRHCASGFTALNRELNNMKKALIEVTVTVPEDCSIQNLDCIHCITVTHTTAYTWKTSDDR